MADFDSMVPDAPATVQVSPHPQAMSFDSLVDDAQAQQNQYGTLGQQVAAGVEGLGRGIAGPVATAIEKNYYRVPSEDIRGRQEANPITAGVGETTGLIGGALTGTGEAALLEGVGNVVAHGAGLAKPASYISRVGSSVVRNAAEMAAYQGLDEVNKQILDDPNAGAQSAISNIGLAAVLGGAGGGFFTGAVSPLWHATTGSKLAANLKSMVSHLGGIEGAEVSSAESLLQKAGLDAAPEIKAVLNDKPTAREAHSILSQDDSSIAGRAYQEKLKNLDSQMANKTAEYLGKTPDEILNIAEKNHYETGQNLGKTLHSELKPVVEEINNRYDAVTNQFKNHWVGGGPTRQMSEALANKAISEGWHKAEDKASHDTMMRIMKDLPEQKTVAELDQYIKNLKRPFDAPDYHAVQSARNILKNGLEDSISYHMGPGEVVKYDQLRNDYRKLSSHLEDLDTHLHLGKWNGPKTFLNALEEKANQKGETLLSNMTGKNNAALLDLLKNHPETLKGVAEHYKDTLIRNATKGTDPNEMLKVSKLLKDINALSPQQKALIATPEQHAGIEAIQAVKDGLIDPTHNFSNTARTIGKHMKGAVSPISFIAMMLGHGQAGILSHLGTLGMGEVRPGMRLGLLKLLGSTKPVDAAGFAGAAKFFTAAEKGAKVMNTAAENVFKPGIRALTVSQVPTEAKLLALDKIVASNDPKDNEKIMQASSKSHVGYYLDTHQTALTQNSLGALQYLRSLKPTPTEQGPLSAPLQPTHEQEARYNRALEIAQQPAIVLQHVKDGTLKASDIQDLNTMYPALYQQMTQKLSNEMIAAKSEEHAIPYKTKVSLSLFLGQPIDATMTPTSIQAAQTAFMQPQGRSPQGQAQGSTKRGTSTIGKSNKSYQTTSQAAESDRSNRD